jgi:hypothetical protein
MKRSATELILPNTLAECHARIQQLRAELAASQPRVTDLEAQNLTLQVLVRVLADQVLEQERTPRRRPPPPW